MGARPLEACRTIESPRRGFWQLTQKGLEFAGAHPAPFSEKDVEQIASGFMDVRLRPQTGEEFTSDDASVTPNLQPTAAVASPDDRLGDALSEMRRTVAAELQKALASISPEFFETVVLDVLHRYGTSRTDLQRAGGAGDGGIDGVISLDKLGLEKVYVQAKRWQQPPFQRSLRKPRRLLKESTADLLAQQ